MSDTSLITFKAIANFTKDLGEVFASHQHSLRLYCHLINKTTISHEKAIKKHIDAFREFCITNREAIEQKDYSKLKNNKIEKIKTGARIVYSKNVYIDISDIFKIADEDTRNVIWKHILVISALCDPTSAAKKILKASSNKDTIKETDFIADLISKVETHVKPDSNPMEAVSSIMKSGVFTDIVSNLNKGMTDGSLDLGKLIGNVQNMVSTLNTVKGEGNGPDMSSINDMLKNLPTNLDVKGKKPSSSSDEEGKADAPDLSAIFSMMGPMMASLQGNMSGENMGGTPDLMNIMSTMTNMTSMTNLGESKSIEEKINEQVEKTKNKKQQIEEID
jgi:hypothetical protein